MRIFQCTPRAAVAVLTAFSLLALFGNDPSAKADLVTNFDGITNGGWTLTNGGTLMPVADVEGTGIAGIQFSDTSSGENLYVSPWTGDLSAQIGETLRYGLVFVRPNLTATWVPTTADVIITDGTTELSANLSYDDVEPLLGTVLDQNVLLDAATFGTDTATFATVMSNVTSLQIRAEHWDQQGVEGYLTNQQIPEPATAQLAGLVLATFLLRRRKRLAK